MEEGLPERIIPKFENTPSQPLTLNKGSSFRDNSRRHSMIESPPENPSKSQNFKVTGIKLGEGEDKQEEDFELKKPKT